MSDTASPTQRGLGLAAAVPQEAVLEVAAAVKQAGYHSFWLNNPGSTIVLPRLGQVAQHQAGIWLGVGVIPLSSQGPEAIVQSAEESRLPMDRFYLGIGSGSGKGSVERVEEGIRVLRDSLKCYVVVAAMGPRMCRLAGREADGILLNWLTPEHARKSVGWIREAAEEVGRPVPRIMAYVRVALGEESIARLRQEAANYESYPAYAAHFRRAGVSAMDTAVYGDTREEIQRGLAAWDGVVDEVVVRAIGAADTAEAIGQIVEAAGPMR